MKGAVSEMGIRRGFRSKQSHQRRGDEELSVDSSFNRPYLALKSHRVIEDDGSLRCANATWTRSSNVRVADAQPEPTRSRECRTRMSSKVNGPLSQAIPKVISRKIPFSHGGDLGTPRGQPDTALSGMLTARSQGLIERAVQPKEMR